MAFTVSRSAVDREFETFTAKQVLEGYRRAIAADQRQILRIMQRAAEQHHTALQRSYPIGPTGSLRNRVRLEQRNEFSWRVLASAPHVGLFERGTRLRRTHGGANRGVMPAAGAIFIPLAVRYRIQAYDAVRALLARTVEV